MRALLGAGMAALGAGLFGASVQQAYAQPAAGASVRGGSRRVKPEPEDKDPYSGISSRGRTGAGARLKLQQAAFDQTPIGRGRNRIPTSNPFLKSARADAFVAATAELEKTGRSSGWIRRQAMKRARRVAA